MALRGDEEVANKQVILKDYVMSGFPKNSDMNVIVARQNPRGVGWRFFVYRFA
jgi:hypothetical protein